MDTNMTELREEAVKFLNQKAEKWDLTEIKAGEEDVLARAGVGMKTDCVGRPSLVLRLQGGGVAVEVRQIARFGSGGSTSNRVTYSFLNGLFSDGLPDDHDKAFLVIQLLQIMAQQYIATPRTADDLIAAVVCGSNQLVNRTKAVVDVRDGECYTSINISGDVQKFKAEVEEAAARTLQHALMIVKFIRIARDQILPDQSYAVKSAIDSIADILDRSTQQKKKAERKSSKAKKQETVSQGPGNQEPEVVL